MKKILTITLIAFFCVPSFAQLSRDENRYRLTIEEAEKLIPRPGKAPVKNLAPCAATPLDTLNTEDEHIKVLLFADNTWRYIKTPDFKRDEEIFTKYWDDVNTNPYHIELSSLPDSWSIWLVDSLGQYYCPYQGEVFVRGKFGIRRGRRHLGVDIPLKTGDPVYAAFTGKVRISKYLGGYGNMVVIRHENGLETFYGHLSKRLVEADQWVNAGDVIGYGGSTGRSTGPHLHFETRFDGFAFDPQWLIDFKTGELRHRLFVLKKKYFNPSSNFEQNFDDEEKNIEEDKKEDAAEAAKAYYKIKSGDTLGRIAINNHTTVKALCRLNNMKETDILSVGKTIRVR